MNYKYSIINPIEHKQLYMYSEYHGIKFIDAYKKNRISALKMCLKRLKNISDPKDKIFEAFKSFTFDEYNKESIHILYLELIINKFNFFKNNDVKFDSEIIRDMNFILFDKTGNKSFKKQKIDKLIKIFEIKKSFSEYFEKSTSANRLNNQFDEVFHLTFSYVLSEYFSLLKSFKYLSALFKINDLLIYRLNNQNFINLQLLSCSIGLELITFDETKKDILGN